jgi:hypothetical protein
MGFLTFYQQLNNSLMPYRRLPNTDRSRVRAMKKAFDKGKELPTNKLAYSAKTLIRLEKFLPQFEHSVHQHRDSITSRNRKNRVYNDTVKKARIYLTHFIKVMNMAIFRGELPAETRAFYGLATDNAAVPLMNTETELLNWGRRIIEGEEYRIRKSGSPITNPTIAVVKVRFGSFLDALNNQNILTQKTQDFGQKIVRLREEADEIILQIWNDVEKAFSVSPEEQRKELCESYGLVYFYRKNEILKMRSLKAESSEETKS